MSSKIKEVPGRVNFSQLEDEVIKFWKENRIFEKSVEQRPEEKSYRFVDGPPFVSGTPHYGHILCSVAKDVVPRYWTMRGHKVRRVWGWDCHGLPIEDKVNKKFGIKSSQFVESEFGVERYVEECRKYVKEFSDNWRWYVEKLGRWVDMDNAYYTMNPEFNESVIWAFKQMWEKGYIYKGKRVSLYSTDTQTPVSNFEVAMDPDNYQDTKDLSVFIKFELESHNFDLPAEVKDKKVSLVAWTTTAWTLPSNFALAVNPKFTYSLVEFNGELLIVAKDRLEYAFDVDAEHVGETPDKTVKVLREFSGSELDGLKYQPLFDFYLDQAKEADYHVYLSPDVTDEDGTGVLHIAPAFGEVDYNFGLEKGLSDIADIDEEGRLTVGEWAGKYLRTASPEIAEYLAANHKLLRSLEYSHRLPYYRGENPLIYMAQDSYFVDVQKIKPRMLELNQEINWYPENVKDGRAKNTFETSPDWAISRSRFWATIMPLWIAEDGENLVVGSMEEMTQYTDQLEKREEDGKPVYYMDGKKLFLHRDFCDKIVLTKDGKEFKRVPYVLDSWLDAGSVPFAEYHYPFENKEVFAGDPAADFIVEYIGQVRAWFNVLLRVSTILFDDKSFKNVVSTGVVGGNDGRKMSKTYGNYPDPEAVLKDKGAEAVRLYMMGSPLMNGGDAFWSDEDLNEYVKTVLIPFWNTYRYLTMYVNMHGWNPTTTEFTSDDVLDQWIKNYLFDVSNKYTEAMENYNLPESVKLIQPAIDNLSTWWIRRSRDRFANGDHAALQTLYASVVHLAKTFAPQMAFLTENVYQNLVVEAGLESALESIHLELYPEKADVDTKLLADMEQVRAAASLGLNLREEKGLKLRQPLNKLWVNLESDVLRELLKDELNVKHVEFSNDLVEDDGLESREDNGVKLTLDTNLTEELKAEGIVSDFARNVQVLRREGGFQLSDKVSVKFSTESDEIASAVELLTGALSAKVGASSVERVDELEGGKSSKIGDFDVTIVVE